MFGYGYDKRVLYVILALLVLMNLSGMTREAWIAILLTLPAVVIAITFHEFAHAFAADKLGDRTPRSQGRLSLNPLKHLDPVGFVLLMFAHVGWGKPVEINPNNFTSNKSKSACEAIVSLAGPLMNFIIAFVLIILGTILSKFTGMAFQSSFWGQILITLIYITITVNIGLGVFNLIPLPPLDGEKIFRHILPYRAQEWLDRNSYILNMAFIILWITGYLGTIVAPIINVIEGVMFFVVELIFRMFM